MIKIPVFSLYGQKDSKIEEEIQPTLSFRQWSDLSSDEKEIAFQELKNNGWVEQYSEEILKTIIYLNFFFLRQCPGKNLHNIKPDNGYGERSNSNIYDRMKAALIDFQYIFLQEKSDAMVFRMLSKFSQEQINMSYYNQAIESKDKNEIEKYIELAFKQFDVLANCLNHIFEQFSINQIVTRNGFIPRQDEKIVNEIYVPTLKALSDHKWRSVDKDLLGMFEDYRDKKYPEVITKAHSVVQRFLQIIVGDEGKNSKGEISHLFKKAKEDGIISANRFIEPIIIAIQSFIPSERATNSTAKPALKEASSSDALLMMNVVMILLQHCLQNIK